MEPGTVKRYRLAQGWLWRYARQELGLGTDELRKFTVDKGQLGPGALRALAAEDAVMADWLLIYV